MLVSALPSIRIYLLGRFEVVYGERILGGADWSRRKAAALLQRLALERRLVKDQAIDFLWPEADLAAGANNLYRTLHALRQTLDTKLGPGVANGAFTFEDGVLSLTEVVWVDVHEFERLLTASRPSVAANSTASHEASNARLHLETLEQALALYQGDLLPDDLYAEWTLGPRETLRRQRREASLALTAHYREVHAYPNAVALLTPLLNYDPADELIHRELMRLYTLAGRRHEALRQYQTCVEALAAELEVSPEVETTALYTQILNGELAPPPPAPLPAWLPPPPLTVAVERSTPLVGRQAELETLHQQLHTAWRGQGRTILLAGEPGVGKTRLAYEALRAAASAGMTTLLGAAYEQAGQWPYQPFIEAFDHYLAERRRPLDDNPITHFTGLGSTDPQQEQWALFNAAVTFLTRLAGQAPVVLLVDDLHAADETSLRLFHYLARQTRAAPVILLATYRSDVVASTGSPFAALLNVLYRERLSETLHLTPLPKKLWLKSWPTPSAERRLRPWSKSFSTWPRGILFLFRK
jgi:DNA-binding SARP family transcriptional activator